MKADFSRNRFDVRKHYSAVLYQQGRVITDADLNEEHALQEYRSERAGADIVGPVGAPERAPGFGISLDANSALTIGSGRLYVDGILFENDVSLAYAGQAHWPALPASPGSNVRQQLADAGAAIGLVYLAGYRRAVTALDDDSIRDPALGGPDTSARSQVVWRVGVQPIAAAANGITLNAASVASLAARIDEVAAATADLAAATTDAQRRTRRLELAAKRRALRKEAAAAGLRCGRDFAEWRTLTAPGTGSITIGTNPGTGSTSPCDAPPGSGYFSGEHQLYRIEVHSTGAVATSSDSAFKFSRENGSVAALIEAAGAMTTGTVTASQVRVSSTGRDVDLGLADQQWVEYVDDSLELAGLPGPLVQIQQVKRESSIVELATSIQIRFGLHPKLRRWDQAGAAATAGGVAMGGGGPVQLERNLRVTFSTGTYRVGDYWTFAVRGGAPDAHLPSGPQTPAGIERHFARLGLLLLDGSNRLRLLFDCRPGLPELTALQAEDVAYAPGCDRLGEATTVQEALDILCGTIGGGRCTGVATPGAGWERVFDAVPDGGDATICFPVGSYPAPAGGVVVERKGHVTLVGCGEGSVVDNASGECALFFRSCAGVTVRDLSMRAQATSGPDLRGALTCIDCRQVTVESVRLESGDASDRQASCLTVRNEGLAPDLVNAQPSLRVRGCTIVAGRQQDRRPGRQRRSGPRRRQHDRLQPGSARAPDRRGAGGQARPGRRGPHDGFERSRGPEGGIAEAGRSPVRVRRPDAGVHGRFRGSRAVGAVPGRESARGRFAAGPGVGARPGAHEEAGGEPGGVGPLPGDQGTVPPVRALAGVRLPRNLPGRQPAAGSARGEQHDQVLPSRDSRGPQPSRGRGWRAGRRGQRHDSRATGSNRG